MSILSPQDNAKAIKDVLDQEIDHAGTDTPGVFERLLDALTKFEVVFTLRRK